VRLRRRPLAAACTFLAVLAALLALAPHQPDAVVVVVTGRALPAGTVLTAADVGARSIPAEAAPQGAMLQADQAVGATLAAPLTAGSILTDASVAAGERLARPGFVVVALPLPSSAIAALVKPGAVLDLLGTDGGTLAAEVRVLSAPDSDSGLGASSRAALIEVEPQVASKLAQLSSVDAVTIAVR
jgi:pilus assembly protein CpaB